MYYFAFGSDLNRKHLAERAHQAKPRMSATLSNYKIVFNGWSRTWRGATATLQPSLGDRMPGGLYELTELIWPGWIKKKAAGQMRTY
jgi:gamma-glutamylcyclotransferase